MFNSVIGEVKNSNDLSLYLFFLSLNKISQQNKLYYTIKIDIFSQNKLK